MFKIANNRIYITRGDVATIDVEIYNPQGEQMKFQTGDIVRLVLYKQGDPETVYLAKDITVSEESKTASIGLASDDTRFADVNYPKTCWFEVELNPETAPQTIIGYDEQGPKEFTIYPEGVVINE